MLHALELPKITERYLTEVVEVQMAFLSCAVAATDIETSPPSLDREKFARQMDQQSKCAGRGQELANWAFRGEKRPEFLTTFATHYCSTSIKERREEQALKQAWCEARSREVYNLLDPALSQLEVDDFFAVESIAGEVSPGVLKWKNAARDFLLYFYENYLEKDTQFPSVLFTDKQAIFGRQALLQAFRKRNEELEICAVCDQGRYYDTSSGRVYAELDHYLPKYRYPHFACHPYNLIPVCHGCNASQKGMADPFPAGNPRRLNKHSLPYRSNLRDAVYLSVDLSGLATVVDPSELDGPKKVIKLERLLPRGDNTEIAASDLEEAIAILNRLYHIPDRWASPEQSNRIRGTLFRRMRHFLNAVKRAPLESDTTSHIYNYLDILLYYLAHEDQQKDPFAFAMTWMLVALINAYRQDPTGADVTDSKQSNRSDPFFEEIIAWYKLELDPEENAKHVMAAKKLLEIPRSAVSKLEKGEE
jgi:hypothetical protein